MVWSSNTAQHFCFDLVLTSLVKPSNYLIMFSTDCSLTLMSTEREKKNMLWVETTTAITSKNWQNLMSYPTSRECEDLVFCWMQFYHKNCLVSNCQSKAQWILSPQNYITASSRWDIQYMNQLGNTWFTEVKHLLYATLQPYTQAIWHCNGNVFIYAHISLYGSWWFTILYW